MWRRKTPRPRTPRVPQAVKDHRKKMRALVKSILQKFIDDRAAVEMAAVTAEYFADDLEVSPQVTAQPLQPAQTIQDPLSLLDLDYL